MRAGWIAGIAWVVGCADAEQILTTTTDGGSWTITVDGVPMQGLVARLSATPGEVRWPGRALGVDPPEWAPPQ